MGLNKGILALIACANAVGVITETRVADAATTPEETQPEDVGSDLNWPAFNARMRSLVLKSARYIMSDTN